MNIDIKIRENKNYKKCVTFVMFVTFSLIKHCFINIYKNLKSDTPDVTCIPFLYTFCNQ